MKKAMAFSAEIHTFLQKCRSIRTGCHKNCPVCAAAPSQNCQIGRKNGASTRQEKMAPRAAQGSTYSRSSPCPMARANRRNAHPTVSTYTRSVKCVTVRRRRARRRVRSRSYSSAAAHPMAKAAAMVCTCSRI